VPDLDYESNVEEKQHFPRDFFTMVKKSVWEHLVALDSASLRLTLPACITQMW
jgi:hypothetical protein